MSDVIFAYTQHNYESYADFKRLVELSGYPSCYVDEIDPASDNTYIVTPLNGEWEQGWSDAKARIILWDLEWRSERPNIPGVAEVWASDPWYAEQIGARFVLLGSHPGLNLHPADRRENFSYDVAFMSYLGPWRRQVIEGEFKRAGISLAPNGWGEYRHNALMQSRLMVHVHQHDVFPCIAPQRWAIAAAYKMPLISEKVTCKITEILGAVAFADYEHLTAATVSWLANPLVQALGEGLYHVLCVEHPFRREVERAL